MGYHQNMKLRTCALLVISLRRPKPGNIAQVLVQINCSFLVRDDISIHQLNVLDRDVGHDVISDTLTEISERILFPNLPSQTCHIGLNQSNHTYCQGPRIKGQ